MKKTFILAFLWGLLHEAAANHPPSQENSSSRSEAPAPRLEEALPAARGADEAAPPPPDQRAPALEGNPAEAAGAAASDEAREEENPRLAAAQSSSEVKELPSEKPSARYKILPGLHGRHHHKSFKEGEKRERGFAGNKAAPLSTDFLHQPQLLRRLSKADASYGGHVKLELLNPCPRGIEKFLKKSRKMPIRGKVYGAQSSLKGIPVNQVEPKVAHAIKVPLGANIENHVSMVWFHRKLYQAFSFVNPALEKNSQASDVLMQEAENNKEAAFACMGEVDKIRQGIRDNVENEKRALAFKNLALAEGKTEKAEWWNATAEVMELRIKRGREKLEIETKRLTELDDLISAAVEEWKSLCEEKEKLEAEFMRRVDEAGKEIKKASFRSGGKLKISVPGGSEDATEITLVQAFKNAKDLKELSLVGQPGEAGAGARLQGAHIWEAIRPRHGLLKLSICSKVGPFLLQKIAEKAPNLEELTLERPFGSAISEETLREVFKLSWPKLKSLTIGESEAPVQGLRELKAPCLTAIRLLNVDVGVSDFLSFMQATPTLTDIEIKGGIQTEEGQPFVLPADKEIRFLSLPQCNIDDQKLALLFSKNDLKKLECLNLRLNEITSKGLKTLLAKDLPCLKKISLRCTKIGKEGIEILMSHKWPTELESLDLLLAAPLTPELREELSTRFKKVLPYTDIEL